MIILSLIALLLLGILIVLLNKDISWNKGITNYNKIIYQNQFNPTNVNEINIEAFSTDVKIEESYTDQIEVMIQGQKEKEATISLENNILKIQREKYNNFCIGFCFYESKIIVKIPQSFDKRLEIKSKSGDVEVGHFQNINMNITTISGDIEIQEGKETDIESKSGDIAITKANSVIARTTSGDIELKVIMDYVKLESTSGEIEIENLTLKKSTEIKTTSGDINIDKINEVYIETKTVSGDTNIKNSNRHALIELLLTTTSGDIEVGD